MTGCATSQPIAKIPDSLLTCPWPPAYHQADEATQADAADALTATYLAGDSCADNLRRVKGLLKKERGLLF